MRNILKDHRKSKKMTQKQIADLLGVSRSAYTNIEIGIRNPSFPLSLKIKEILEYRHDDIFANEEAAQN